MGRRPEKDAVEKLLALARSGRSGVLVLRGEAGIGKTAVLEQARAAALAASFRVETAAGVESESQFAFAGLHQLCATLVPGIDALPEPQQSALGVAFGLHAGPPPDRFLVGLAVLSLLADVAEGEPLLCVVDDAQWLDEASAQVLAFVARRVAAERLALVFGVRDTDDGAPLALAGLPEMRLGRLEDPDARALLDAAVQTPLDAQVRERLLAEAAGNPLALLELPRDVQPAELAGGYELPDSLTLPHRIEESFRRRSSDLPSETQLLLLIAASEPTGDAALLWRASEPLGLGRDAARPAEDAGLLELDARVRFHHPLVRSAVYRAAAPPDRRRAHAALADATDPDADPDRRAWHCAQATLGPDEDVARALERSAASARARGGVAAAAAFLAHAVDLSPDPAGRARRALAGAHAKHEAGATPAALDLLAVAEVGPLDALARARLELLRAQVAFHQRRVREVPAMLLAAAGTLAPLDPALARETYLDAIDAALVTGGTSDGALRGAAEAARTAPAAPNPPRPEDLLLDGLVTTFTRGYEPGLPELRRALRAFADDEPGPENVAGSGHRWLWLVSRTAMAVFDDELAHDLADRHLRVAREVGALATLPAALLVRSVMLVLAGELGRASELIAAQTAFSSGAVPVRTLHAELILAAWRGRTTEIGELHAALVRDAEDGGDDNEVVLAQYAIAVLHNGLRDYATALAAATRAFRSAELSHSNLAHSELVEAAVRAGEPASATAAMEELCARARASGTAWALGMAARAQALLSTGPAAEDHYREAIARLGTSRMGGYLARTHLVFGEWLRREGRRRDARAQLRTAHDLLTGMGAEAFAARAARELRATGEHPRARASQPTDALTPQELQVARVVATGATSREVAAQLFLSPRTVEAHLRNIFRKLGITSRRELRGFRLP